MVAKIAAGVELSELSESLNEVAKQFKDFNNPIIHNGTVKQLQEAIQTALLQRASDLEKELERSRAWEAERQRYILTDYGCGTFACVPKPEETLSENPHRLCANCFQEEHKSVLRFDGRTIFRQDIYSCTRCKTVFHLGCPRDPNPPSRAKTR